MLKLSKLFMPLALLIILFVDNLYSNDDPILRIEINNESKCIEEILIYNKDIEVVYYNEQRGIPKIEIVLVKKMHDHLEQKTQKLIGKKYRIVAKSKTVATGTLRVPIREGYIALPVSTLNEAERIAKKIGLKVDEYKFKREDNFPEIFENEIVRKAHEEAMREEYDKAIFYIKQAIEKNSNEPNYYGLLSYYYYAKGDKEAALKFNEKAVSFVSSLEVNEHTGLYMGLGRLYLELGKPDQAIKIFKEYLSINEDHLEMRLRLAQAYEKSGNNELALNEYTRLSKSKSKYYRNIGIEKTGKLE